MGCGIRITTKPVTEITPTTAMSGGMDVLSGDPVVEKGIVWSTKPNPTTGDFTSKAGAGISPFTLELTNLTPGETYYVRAYATTACCTQYGNQEMFSAEMFTNGAADGCIITYQIIQPKTSFILPPGAEVVSVVGDGSASSSLSSSCGKTFVEEELKCYVAKWATNWGQTGERLLDVWGGTELNPILHPIPYVIIPNRDNAWDSDSGDQDIVITKFHIAGLDFTIDVHGFHTQAHMDSFAAAINGDAGLGFLQAKRFLFHRESTGTDTAGPGGGRYEFAFYFKAPPSLAVNSYFQFDGVTAVTLPKISVVEISCTGYPSA